MPQYRSAGSHGPLADSSQELVAVARGDSDPDTIVRNGRVVNVHTGEIRKGRDLVIAAGRIARVTDAGEVDGAPETEEIDADGQFLAPGFLDTHVHYESSMTTATGCPWCRPNRHDGGVHGPARNRERPGAGGNSLPAG